ncbi:MAG TPA: type I 3-dehydroquinate dehydratase [Chlamydiales bacterium]|nr:type I 3-dehydroquinate dehydratase [Chlamydiales bacterium]
MLIACIIQPSYREALAEIERARIYAQGIELRLDCFQEHERLPELMAQAQLPVMFTGCFSEELLDLQPAYCDVEADVEQVAKKYPKIHWIRSYHNFEETPEDLGGLLEGMRRPWFSSYKLALKANSTIDMLRLMAFKRSCPIPLSAIAMGEWGMPSRVLGPVMGNVFDYASSEEVGAPLCRYSLKTLHDVFRFSQLNRETEIFALIGDPVEASIGHLFHNREFGEQNAVYVKMRLGVGELPQFFPLIKQLPFCGLSVTMPLKEAIVPFLDEGKGAINTVLGMRGFNTDGVGALNVIERYFPVQGKRVAILGAGGTARAIASEAMKRGARVSIYNRTEQRAKALAAGLGCVGGSLGEVGEYELLINTIPGQERLIEPTAAVMDVVYAPRETPILRAAKERGHLCIYGEEMFYEQARLQQQLFRRAPFS